MVVVLLFLILLVIAWPIFALFGVGIFAAVGSNLHIVLPVCLFLVAYAAIMIPAGRKYNLKFGGKVGEAIDPTKPTGLEYVKLMEEEAAREGKVPPQHISFFNTPDQWNVVSNRPQDERAVRKAPRKRGNIVVMVMFAAVLAGGGVVILLDMAKASGLIQRFPSGPTIAATAIPSMGKWRVDAGRSAMLEASAGTNGYGQPATLTVYCDAIWEWPELKIDFRDYLGSDQGIDDFKTVILQVRSGPVQQFRMTLGRDGTTLILDGQKPELIRSLLGEGVFTIYTAPYSAEPVNARFDLAGAKAAVQPVLDACE